MVPRSPSSPRNVALYLDGLRTQVDAISTTRQEWIRELGLLLRDIRSGDPEIATRAHQVGEFNTDRFRRIEAQVGLMSPPPVCEACHSAVQTWLTKMIAACEVMVEVGVTGEIGRLRETQGLLAESRADTLRFRSEYDYLIAQLRARVKGAPDRGSSPMTSVPHQSAPSRSGGIKWFVRGFRGMGRKAANPGSSGQQAAAS